MQAHAEDLRAELPDLQPASRDALVEEILRDWRTAEIPEPDRLLCRYADKLTRTPAAMTALDVMELHEAGFDDTAIHDAIQVIGYFNYINRVADAFHVDLEPGMAPYPDETMSRG